VNVLAILGAVLSILVGGASTLCWMVLIVAGMPNSSPAQEAMLWRFFWAVATGGLLCATAAVALIVARRTGWATTAGAFPLAAFVVFLVVALAVEW
jgi:hypothetical protein